MSHHDWDWASQCGQDCGQRWQVLWVVPTLTPSPSPECGFESDRSSVSTSSSVSSQSHRLVGFRHTHYGWCRRELRGPMKINLPVFKDEDKKDTIIYQSWYWDLMVYHHAGCWDHLLLPYSIHSLQGYPGELVRSSESDVTLDGILTILDEHYNNVKASDALTQELFQLHMSEKEMCQSGRCISWGTSKFLWLHSQNAFHQITSLNWSVTASMAGCLSSLRWWWHTSSQVVMRRHIPIIS